MSAKTTMAALKSKIQTGFTDCNNRVYTVASKGTMRLFKPYAMPSVSIVYMGGDRLPHKGSYIEVHLFDVYVFGRIMQEESVVMGGAGKKGLMEMVQDLKDLLYTGTDSDLVVDTVHLCDISRNHGTEEWMDGSSLRGTSASIGFRIEYREHVT